jgi:hypothetical protein
VSYRDWSSQKYQPALKQVLPIGQASPKRGRLEFVGGVPSSPVDGAGASPSVKAGTMSSTAAVKPAIFTAPKEIAQAQIQRTADWWSSGQVANVSMSRKTTQKEPSPVRMTKKTWPVGQSRAGHRRGSRQSRIRGDGSDCFRMRRGEPLPLARKAARLVDLEKARRMTVMTRCRQHEHRHWIDGRAQPHISLLSESGQLER